MHEPQKYLAVRLSPWRLTVFREGATAVMQFDENAPKLQARFPAVWLDKQLTFAEPHAYLEAVVALEHELHLIGATDDLLERTRAALGNGASDLEEIAALLGVSSRTLRRHLAARATTFHALRDESRARALSLLANAQLTIEGIARDLGYADAAGFSRAFQRWTRESPASYRRRIHPSSRCESTARSTSA